MQGWFLACFLKLSLFVCFCLCWVFLQCGLPSSCSEWGLPMVLGCERLTLVASFVPEHGLLSSGASEIVVQMLSCSTGCGVFLD